MLLVWLTLVCETLACEAARPLQSEAEADQQRFAIVKTDAGLRIRVDGQRFADYTINAVNKPYLWPIIGPTGKPMTRAYPMEQVPDEAKEQQDHPHHRGLLFGHESAGLGDWKFPASDQAWETAVDKHRNLVGGDTWHEAATFAEYRTTPELTEDGQRRTEILATIQHREFVKLDADDNRALVIEICDYFDRDHHRFLVERRTLVFRVTDDQRTIDVEQEFTAPDGDAIFEDRKDAGLAIRVPTSMAMDSKQGGVVINSDGEGIEKAWGQPAKWCDYHGPVVGEHLGIAFLSHPSSYRFPTRWHVREYGLFSANPFGQKSFNSKMPSANTVLRSGDHLFLKHRLIFHRGDPESANIEAAWQAYASGTNQDCLGGTTPN